MAEPDKRQVGEGSDNYGEAAKQMANAAKQVGKESAKQAAAAGTKAVANASAAVVQASVEGGKAAAQIAAGTAAGGPWGAILSAAWALRHTLFKVLVCICLFFLLIIVMIVSLPSIILNSVFGLDGTPVDMEILLLYSNLTMIWQRLFLLSYRMVTHSHWKKSNKLLRMAAMTMIFQWNHSSTMPRVLQAMMSATYWLLTLLH